MNAWVVFRRARIVLFSFLVILCFTWAAFFAVFLGHEWSHFSEFQKIVVAFLLSLYGFSAILLYLMAVARFNLWWDVARVVSLLIVHTGSSVVFTQYRASFPCRGFVTEATCKDFIFVIFIGCWVFSGMILCFSIAVGIMAFLPRPVESMSGSGEPELPPSPASFKAGSLFSQERPPSFYSFDSHMGLVDYGEKSEFRDESLSRARTLVLASGVSQEPPRLWQSFQTQSLRNGTDDPIYDKTIIAGTDGPPEPANIDVKSRRQNVDSLYLNPYSPYFPPPSSTYSPTKIADESRSVSQSIPPQLPTLPEPMYGFRTATPDSMLHDRTVPYTPTTYVDPSASNFPATFRDSHQPGHVYPGDMQMNRPNKVNSYHSSVGSIHSKWAATSPHVVPPPVLTLGVAPSSTSFIQGLPPTYHAQNATVKRNVSLPNMTDPNHDRRQARQSYTSLVMEPVTESFVDHGRWRRLVLSAATTP